jgi:hypothetical protein
MPKNSLARILPISSTPISSRYPSGVKVTRNAYGVVWLNEGVVDGDDLDIIVLDAADGR